MSSRRHPFFKLWKAAEATAVALLPYRRSHVSDARWEDQYTSGHWEYLQSLEQLARYRVIAGYCEHYAPTGTVLDVGCGDGYLRDLLGPAACSSYVGLDLSAEAIRRAQHRSNESTRFVQGDVDDFEHDGSFDAVIFNESLYYLERPLAVLERYASFLRDDGVMIVSMHGLRPWNRRLWRMIDAVRPPLDGVTVEHHDSGKHWTIKVYAR